MDHSQGFINSSVAGRTDRLPLAVGTDSHVIPADVVAGLGQGNSLAGADILDRAFKIGPYGTPKMPVSRGGAGMPRAPQTPTSAATGGAMRKTPIMAAGGEYVVPEWKVHMIGGGSMSKGHKIIDKMISEVRKHNMEFLKHAPAPKK